MPFDFVVGLVAGLAGGVAMSLLMFMARKAGMTKMDIALLEGTMFTSDTEKARGIGMAVHLLMMSALVFGTIYAALFSAFDIARSDAWWVGLVFGAVHGLVAGVGMVMMPRMHPRVGQSATAGGLRLEPPGPFGKNYGAATPMGMMVSHLTYGLVVGLVYAALV